MFEKCKDLLERINQNLNRLIVRYPIELSSRFFCLKLKISKITELFDFYFLEKLYLGPGMFFFHLPNLYPFEYRSSRIRF